MGGGWSKPRPRNWFTPGKDPVTIVQEAGSAPEPVWTGGKSRPHRDLIPVGIGVITPTTSVSTDTIELFL